MAIDPSKLQAAIAQAASQGPDLNVAQKGGSYTPPKAGSAIMTLIAYIETGVHHDAGNPAKNIAPKDNNCAELVFEIHGKGHEPKVLEDGTVIPERMTVKLTVSRNEKAWYYKIFKQLNYDGQATHFAQLLGKMYKGTIFHSKGKDDKVYANLRDANGYHFGAAVYNPDPMDMTITAPFPQQQVHSELKAFLWDYCDVEQWNSLYIPGQYDEEKDESGKVTRAAKSKNVLQDKIRSALNFPGSPIAELLEGLALDLPETAAPAAAAEVAPDADPLATGTTPSVSVDDALADL